jgi:hypothetical protein
MYINNWNEVPVGAKVIQDTYNEIYEVFINDKFQKCLRVVGFQVPSKRDNVIGQEQVIDFDASCIYDQPWIRIR